MNFFFEGKIYKRNLTSVLKYVDTEMHNSIAKPHHFYAAPAPMPSESVHETPARTPLYIKRHMF
jgi:hypothetical protein